MVLKYNESLANKGARGCCRFSDRCCKQTTSLSLPHPLPILFSGPCYWGTQLTGYILCSDRQASGKMLRRNVWISISEPLQFSGTHEGCVWNYFSFANLISTSTSSSLSRILLGGYKMYPKGLLKFYTIIIISFNSNSRLNVNNNIS